MPPLRHSCSTRCSILATFSAADALQAVLVHVDAGTANACMAIQNLFRYRLPVMMFAGRAPHTLHGELTGSRDTYVHFVQDPFDIASIVRRH